MLSIWPIPLSEVCGFRYMMAKLCFFKYPRFLLVISISNVLFPFTKLSFSGYRYLLRGIPSVISLRGIVLLASRIIHIKKLVHRPRLILFCCCVLLVNFALTLRGYFADIRGGGFYQ